MSTNSFCSLARRWLPRLALLALLLALGALVAAPAHAAPKATRLVSPSGTDSGDCTSSPCKTITYALTKATAGDTINVAAGTYSAANGETLPLTPVVDVTISGAGASSTTIDGEGTKQVMLVSGRTITVQNVRIANGSADDGGGIQNYNSTLTVSNSTFSGNSATNGYGGGIFNDESTLTVSNSTFSGNSAKSGGGIYNSSNSTLTMSNSTFSGNSATNGGGGGIFSNYSTLTVSNSTFSGNSATSTGGGGICNFLNSTLTVSNSTFSGNSTTNVGGGIRNSGVLTVSNSTFSSNSATNNGGGIFNSSMLTVSNSTLSGNSANSGGGIYNYGTLNYANTIITNSTSGGDCFDDWATIGTNTNNLVQDGSCSAIFSGDPQLGALANNGGATQTFALQPNSPAIDAGDAATCSNSPISGLDQRGQARNDLQCDIGAYEMQMSDRNTTTLNPETTMRTFGPPRVGIQYSGTNPGSTTAAKVTNWTGGTPADALGAWWELTPTTNTGLNLTLKLCYSDAELGSLTETNLRFWRYSGGTWSQVGDAPTFSGTSPNRCAQISGVTALSRWTLATGNPGGAPTAVTLSSFRADAPSFDLWRWLTRFLGR